MNKLVRCCVSLCALCGLLISGSAFAVYGEADLPCVLGADKPAVFGWDNVARSFHIDECKCTGVAACDKGPDCDYRPTNQDRVILTSTRIAVVDGNGPKGDQVADQLASQLIQKPAIKAVPETQTWINNSNFGESAGGACFAALEFLPDSEFQIDVSGDCTILIVPRISISLGDDLLTLLQADQRLKWYGGVMEGIKQADLSFFMIFHNAYPDAGHIASEVLNEASSEVFSYVQFLRKGHHSPLDYATLVFSHSRRNKPYFCLHGRSDKTMPQSQIYKRTGPVRVYLLSDGVCIHPEELIINTYSESCEGAVRMIESITTQRMTDESGSCSVAFGLAERYGLSGQTQVASLSYKTEGGEMDDSLDTALKAGWLLPAAKDNRSIVVMDIED
ncbi:hypothetical protein [Spongorhabdus nitratireducens]